jgi:cytochrome b involved in lipid metabolism
MKVLNARIHDDLYDLTDFKRVHPGGEDWIRKAFISPEKFPHNLCVFLHVNMMYCLYIQPSLRPD